MADSKGESSKLVTGRWGINSPNGIFVPGNGATEASESEVSLRNVRDNGSNNQSASVKLAGSFSIYRDKRGSLIPK